MLWRTKSHRNAGISRRGFIAGAAGGAPAFAGRKEAASSAGDRKIVFVVPNFHPASCGWLADFSKERVYCANSYLDHLDRVRDDGHYEFVLSEVNNIIAIMNFQPRRIEELRQRVKDGRVELVDGFFLESTINLSGGEALVRLGIEGLRWQQQVFGVHPRFAWTIDVCGTHDQMAQTPGCSRVDPPTGFPFARSRLSHFASARTPRSLSPSHCFGGTNWFLWANAKHSTHTPTLKATRLAAASPYEKTGTGSNGA